MKGQSKMTRGSSFKDLLNYLLDHDDPEIIGGTMSGTDVRSLTAEFVSVSERRPEIEKPVWCNSLRLPEGEHLSDEKWCAIADDYMREMGFKEGTQYAVIKHNLKAGEHIHIPANRVHVSRELYYGQNENLRSTRVIQKLEKKYGLSISRGPDDTPPRGSAALTKKEIEKSVRTGVAPDRSLLQTAIKSALADKPTTAEFVQRLGDAGITATPNVASTGTMNGFSFKLNDSELAFSGTKLGKDFKWQSLQDLIDYNKDRDTPFLQELKHEQLKISESRSTVGGSGDTTSGKDNDISGAVSADRQDEQRPVDPDKPAVIDAEKGGRDNEGARVVDKPTAKANVSDGVQAGKSDIISSGSDQEISKGNDHPGADNRSRRADPAGSHDGDGVPDLATATDSGRAESSDMVQRSDSGSAAAHRDRSQQIEMIKAAAERIEQRVAPLVKSSSTDKTTLAVKDQLNQMRCDRYEIGIRDSAKDKMMNREATADEIIKLIPKLKQMNANGNDIYIRPAASEPTGLVLVDDIDKVTVQQMIDDDRAPALVVETSPGNVQAWVRIGADVDFDTRLEASRELARIYDADRGSVDGRHYGRLAGFTNQKPEHQNDYGRQPYCLLSRDAYKMADAIKISETLKKDRVNAAGVVAENAVKRDQQKRRDFIAQPVRPIPAYELKKLPDAEQYRHKYQQLQRVFGDKFDASSADYRIVKDMLRDGRKDETEIADIIKAGSPDVLDRKHGHVDQYIERTIEKAHQALQRERSEDAENDNNNDNDLTL